MPMPITHFPVWHSPLKHFPTRHFPGGGSGFYRVYRGTGGILSVDWSAPVAELDPANTNPSLAGLGHAPSTRYTYVLRPVRGGDELESPDLSCAVEFETDASGGWLGQRPAEVEFLEARVAAGGQVQLHWAYRTPYGAEPPADFCIYHASSPRFALGQPQATCQYTSDTGYRQTLAMEAGRTYYFAVTARSSAGIESRAPRIVGPVVADAEPPARPELYVKVSC